MINQESLARFSHLSQKMIREIKKDIVGQEKVVEETVIALIAGGNVLLEGVPGVGKTRLVRSLGRVLDLPFSRIQFTPDLMPADVTGTNILETDEAGKSRVTFQKGPIFSHIVLADEINRATPKTQSALLEAMQEHTVTAGGQTYPLPEPFFVLATQNPIEQDGTYVLPEAQTDRFMVNPIVTFPSAEELKSIVTMTQKTVDECAETVLGAAELLEMRQVANEILVMDEVLDFAVKLVESTHPELPSATDYTQKYIRFGASPRAAQALISCGKVRALIQGRLNVSLEDISVLAYPVLRHRIKPAFPAITEKKTADDLISDLLAMLGADGATAKPAEDKKKKKSLF